MPKLNVFNAKYINLSDWCVTDYSLTRGDGCSEDSPHQMINSW